MKVIAKIVYSFCISVLLLSCGGEKKGSSANASGTEKAAKSPDQKMGDKLIGEFFNDDYSNLSIEYFKDGRYIKKYTETEFIDYGASASMNEYSDEAPSPVEVNWEETGTWKIENGFLKSIVEKIKSDSYHSKEELQEKVKEQNKKSVAYKIKEITEQKLLLTDPDDEEIVYKRKVQ
jgi:hypothetical protein